MAQDVQVRPAATVVLLDDVDAPLRVFMVRRQHTIAFMAGAHVFPGGRVDDADRQLVRESSDPLPADTRGLEPSVYAAALRELFEEAGVLLARDASGAYVSLDDAARRERFDQYRADVHAGRMTLRQLAEREQLQLALDCPVPFARWVTPPTEIRRFDTWFFAARVPAGQHAVHEAIESSDSCWIRPADALDAARGGAMLLPPPTWVTLQALASFTSVDAVLRWASTRAIERRQPELMQDDRVQRMRLIDDLTGAGADTASRETRFVLRDGRWQPETGA